MLATAHISNPTGAAVIAASATYVPVVHVADSKTIAGIGDMPLTKAACDAFRRQMEDTPGSDHLFPAR